MSRYDRLAEELAKHGVVRRDEPLARHTTFGIGGPADLFAIAESAEALRQMADACRQAGAPLFVLGAGSNILVGDGGIRGVVIDNRAHAVQGPAPDSEGRFIVRAESGTSFAALARGLAREGYAGLEWAAGIPGTLGGAIVYNAGAYGGCLADVLLAVSLVNGTGTVLAIPAAELGLTYRGSALTGGPLKERVILSAELQVWPADAAAVTARVAEYDSRRLAAQPRGRNAGSIFKNPPQTPAWKLIDQVGLRGRRIGDAQISEKHCNFFINTGHARAADVNALIDLARRLVYERFGVQLETEIALVGEGFE